MSDESDESFASDRRVDKPNIIGARWWHGTLVDEAARVKRRDAIRGILIAGGVVTGLGGIVAMCTHFASSGSGSGSGVATGAGELPSDLRAERQSALEMQKKYGWSFGAYGEELVFDGVTTKPFQPGALHSLATDLAPSRASLKPYFQPTLFESPDAAPSHLSSLAPEEAAGFRPLAPSVKPIFTPAMEGAYARGKSVASAFASLAEENPSPAAARAALVVDLPGPEAVAFAAGAASLFDPVFLFDNWPHPRGVVRAHETLSAAAYYQPLFAEAKKNAQEERVPMFVLDRRRLAAYTDDVAQFDNRFVAKLPPSISAMHALDVKNILYIVPTRLDTEHELDDLNDEFVLYVSGGLMVRALSLDLFGPDAADRLTPAAGTLYYGGSRVTHNAFFVDYPWAKPPRRPAVRPAVNPGTSFVPKPRASVYSTGNPADPGGTSAAESTSGGGGSHAASKPRPAAFGTVPVVVALGTGAVLGARYSRSGSWNRASGGWGG